MGKTEKKSGSKWKRGLIIAGVTVGVLLAILAGGFVMLVSDYYRADTSAIAAYADVIEIDLTEDGIEKIVGDNYIAYSPKEAEVGFIFYPGALVEYNAYEPLMMACAKRGIFSAVIEMPFHIAMFDIDAADEIREAYPEIKNWYIGGHSLGGSIVGMHLEEKAAEYEGLILLASYSMTDISGSDLKVLSVYGSEDGVLNPENYIKFKTCLPEDITELVIEGGNHAYFGMYGEQDGDGVATVTAIEQTELTAEAIMQLIEE